MDVRRIFVCFVSLATTSGFFFFQVGAGLCAQAEKKSELIKPRTRSQNLGLACRSQSRTPTPGRYVKNTSKAAHPACHDTILVLQGWQGGWPPPWGGSSALLDIRRRFSSSCPFAALRCRPILKADVRRETTWLPSSIAFLFRLNLLAWCAWHPSAGSCTGLVEITQNLRPWHYFNNWFFLV